MESWHHWMTTPGHPHRYFAMLYSYAPCVMMDAKQSVVRVVLHTGRGLGAYREIRNMIQEK
jgi:hypothetical protein